MVDGNEQVGTKLDRLFSAAMALSHVAEATGDEGLRNDAYEIAIWCARCSDRLAGVKRNQHVPMPRLVGQLTLPY
jgi:hypothetical protein